MDNMPLAVAKTIIASSITCSVEAAKILSPLRESNPAVAAWFAMKSTRAALLVFEKLDAEEREILRDGPPDPTGPTALCTEHVPREDAPYQCGKCGKPLGPIPRAEQATAQQIAAFAVEEGFDWVAVVGLRVEADLGPAGPGMKGSLLKVDAIVDMAEEAPPVAQELAVQLRNVADELDKKVVERGHGTVRRQVVRDPSKGNN